MPKSIVKLSYNKKNVPNVTYNTEKGELGYAKPRQVIVKLSNNKKNVPNVTYNTEKGELGYAKSRQVGATELWSSVPSVMAKHPSSQGVIAP